MEADTGQRSRLHSATLALRLHYRAGARDRLRNFSNLEVRMTRALRRCSPAVIQCAASGAASKIVSVHPRQSGSAAPLSVAAAGSISSHEPRARARRGAAAVLGGDVRLRRGRHDLCLILTPPVSSAFRIHDAVLAACMRNDDVGQLGPSQPTTAHIPSRMPGQQLLAVASLRERLCHSLMHLNN